MKDGVVYMLKSKNKSNTGFIYKIGYTINLEQRIKAHRTSNIQFELVYVIKNVDMNYEKFLHRYFDIYRIEKEWFSDKDGIISNFIKRDKVIRKYYKLESEKNNKLNNN